MRQWELTEAGRVRSWRKRWMRISVVKYPVDGRCERPRGAPY